MKYLFSTALVAFASLCGVSSAATVTGLSMNQNNWIVFDLASADDQIRISPLSTDGSFSYSYAYSDSLCPNSWSCMPEGLALNTVHDSHTGNFGYNWGPTQVSNITADTFLNGSTAGQYLFFRVTSGTTSIAKYAAGAGITPAAVPLPASALLMLGGLGALTLLARRRKTA